MIPQRCGHIVPNCGRWPSSRFSVLVDTPERELLMLASNHCIGVGFNNGNEANRSAVKSLMQARHFLTASEANRMIQKLVVAGVLEESRSKGNDGLRLTAESSPKLQNSSESQNLS